MKVLYINNDYTTHNTYFPSPLKWYECRERARVHLSSFTLLYPKHSYQEKNI